jgi:hypothetical protein
MQQDLATFQDLTTFITLPGILARPPEKPNKKSSKRNRQELLVLYKSYCSHPQKLPLLLVVALLGDHIDPFLVGADKKNPKKVVDFI